METEEKEEKEGSATASSIGAESQTPITELTTRTRSRICPSVFGHHMITVEPVIFLTVFTMGLSQAVVTEFLLIRSCEDMKHNSTICKQLQVKTNATASAMLESEVQPQVSLIIMVKMVLEAVFPAVIALFLGPWSDKYGRKLLMIWPLLAYAAHYYMALAMSLIPNLSPWFMLVVSGPVICSGGFLSLMASSVSLITDVSRPERRSLRLGIYDVCQHLGFFTGMCISGHVFTACGDYGFISIFTICGTVCLINALYVTIFVPESVAVKDNYKNPVKNLGKLFDCHLFKDTMKICFRKRPNCHHDTIILMMIVMATGPFTFDGENSVVFLFVRKKFGWEINEFTVFFGVTVLIIVVGTLFGVTILSSVLKISDLTLVLIALITKIVSSLLCALGPDGFYLYIGSGFRLLSALPTPLIRSYISKNIPPEIIGVVFTLSSACEALMPTVAAPLYASVYKATYTVNPGSIFHVSSGAYVIGIILTCVVMIIDRQTPARNID